MRLRTFASLLVLAPSAVLAQLQMPAGFVASDSGKALANPVRLDLAATGRWSDDTSRNANPGVFDPEQWAVVYKYSGTFTLSGGSFTNHPSFAPVIILVDGDVVINGTLDLNGKGRTTSTGNPTEPGPGGFHGGAGSRPGFGPGGGAFGSRFGGSFATQGNGAPASSIYGSPTLFPLIGGSGGAGQNCCTDREGGAGAGAILIYASGKITLNGQIQASGGQGECDAGGGSGGGIRLVGRRIEGNGTLIVNGADGSCSATTGGFGRVRLEAQDIALTNLANMSNTGQAPVFSYEVLTSSAPPKVFVDPATDRTVTAALFVDAVEATPSVAVPADPRPRIIGQLPVDVTLRRPGAWNLLVRTTNVPNDWVVSARLVGANGYSATVTSQSILAQDDTVTTWTLPIADLPTHITAVHVRADDPTP